MGYRKSQALRTLNHWQKTSSSKYERVSKFNPNNWPLSYIENNNKEYFIPPFLAIPNRNFVSKGIYTSTINLDNIKNIANYKLNFNDKIIYSTYNKVDTIKLESKNLTFTAYPNYSILLEGHTDTKVGPGEDFYLNLALPTITRQLFSFSWILPGYEDLIPEIYKSNNLISIPEINTGGLPFETWLTNATTEYTDTATGASVSNTGISCSIAMFENYLALNKTFLLPKNSNKYTRIIGGNDTRYNMIGGFSISGNYNVSKTLAELDNQNITGEVSYYNAQSSFPQLGQNASSKEITVYPNFYDFYLDHSNIGTGYDFEKKIGITEMINYNSAYCAKAISADKNLEDYPIAYKRIMANSTQVGAVYLTINHNCDKIDLVDNQLIIKRT